MALDEFNSDKLHHARVLVVGDSMLDRYWVGDVDRISPEAPVPVICITDEQQRMGGAANVATNIVALNAQAILLSTVGDDAAGKDLAAMLDQAGIVANLQLDPGLRTTVKVRLIARNQQLVRADFESTPSPQALDAKFERYSQLLDTVDVVLVSDYAKGGTRDMTKMISTARTQGKAIYIDPKGADYSIYRGASLITPNLSEFQQVMGKVNELDELDHAAQSLMQDIDLQACLITLGERGMLLCQRDVKPIHQMTRASEVYDVTGAGDTVIALMALGCAAGFSLETAMALANHAAGVVVSKLGTATANFDEIMSSMRTN